MNESIKEQNKKALPKFVVLMIVCLAAGGTLGFLAAAKGTNGLQDAFAVAGNQFALYVAPWILIAIAVIFPMIQLVIYRKAKKMFASWDMENEETAEIIDRKLSIALIIGSVLYIISFVLLAATASDLESMFDSRLGAVRYFGACIAFLAILIEVVFSQQKIVDLTKAMNPEKNGSVYDMKFQKKWLESSDEAEKAMIGKCAFKAYKATSLICAVLTVVLTLGAMLMGTGLLAPLVVGIIWIVNTVAFGLESMKLSGNSISI